MDQAFLNINLMSAHCYIFSSYKTVALLWKKRVFVVYNTNFTSFRLF